jgi:NADH pyrophosphatase NudC (nudix superfamily)
MADGYDDDEVPWDDAPDAATRDLGADAFEQIQLLRERRRLHASRQMTLADLRPCLELKRDIARLNLETAGEDRKRAEAELERARELRALENDRHRVAVAEERAADAEREAQMVKQQATKEIRHLAGYVAVLEDAARDADNKRTLAELRGQIDEHNAEFLTCPECGERMGEPEHGSGKLCPQCNHRRDW